MGIFDEWVLGWPAVGQANTTEVRAALPVLGAPHKGAAQGLNWLLGRGHPLAVCGPQIVNAWESQFFSFWVHPDDLHPNFLWDISLSAIDSINRSRAITGRVQTTVHIPSPDTVDNTFSTNADGTITRLSLREDVDPSNTPQEIHVTITTDIPDPSDSDDPERVVYLVIHGIHVSELPQLRINGHGIAMSTLDARQPIYWYASTPPHESIASLPGVAQVAYEAYARRGAMFSWWTPFSDSENSTTSTSYVEIFPVKPSLQTRLQLKGQTRGVTKCNVAASVTGGTGQVRVSMTTGDSIVFDITTTSMEWATEQELLVATDDPSLWETNGGLRGSARDDITFEMKAPSGQTITIRGLMITESPTSGGSDESANVLVDGGTPITLDGEYIFVPVPYP